MPWIYNTLSGKLEHPTGLLGWTGYISTPGSGWHVLNVPDSATEAQAAAAAQQQYPGSASPTTSGVTALGQGAAAVASAPASVATGWVADLFSGLNSGTWWMRLTEVVLGLLLVAVGVAKLTHAVPIATKIAGAIS